ncbi:uncharacterized protein LOC112083950 [Eutrema salsugineum]|uniref:uncharacterized protein LOC112083950 n=1 Tax=Eutrema salsugineum TaxID=72664 RepID=UPI000CED6F5E|nr:uncharacterized protein LOC112083950 [Eutrema salsugineum]
MALVIRRALGEDDFDEEEVDRDATEIEKMVEEFEDEPSIFHDNIPESDDDDEGEAAPTRPRPRTSFSRGNGILYLNQSFFNGVDFKENVLDYALSTGRNLEQTRYDKTNISFKCLGGDEESGGCQWRVYASTREKDALWKIRILNDKHSCTPNGEVTMLKVPQIARLFLDKIREEPKYYMPMKIEEKIREEWGITVSRPQCQAARNKALRWIECEYDRQFARLRDYAAELRHSNEDSNVVVETLTNEKGEDEFNRFYVCFENLRKTWKNTCRPLIGVDGCFVKHKIKGQLLAALGRDADNSIYPIAWCVVQVENTENWLWFVRMLKHDLELNDGDGFIMVFDRQKGLIAAVQMELPKIEHRMCVRHIYGNLKKNHASKKDMKKYIWNLAWSYNEAEYNWRLDQLLNYDVGVYNDVMKMNPRTWCRFNYKMGNYCEDVENNSTESFNSSIEKERWKPFVPMLETIRRLAMARIAKRSAKSHDHNGICTPYVTKFLVKEYKEAKLCIVTRSTNGDYKARLGGCNYRVNLEKRSCTCLKFQICGIPCEHAYGVILSKKLVPEDFVCHWFRTAMWRRNYTDGLVPTRGAAFWPRSDAPDVHIPPEPPQPGRKKVTNADKKRKKGVNESPTKKQPPNKKRIMHCGICGKADHNSRFHKKDKGNAPSVQPSAAPSVQPSAIQASSVRSSAAPSVLPPASTTQAAASQPSQSPAKKKAPAPPKKKAPAPPEKKTPAKKKAPSPAKKKSPPKKKAPATKIAPAPPQKKSPAKKKASQDQTFASSQGQPSASSQGQLSASSQGQPSASSQGQPSASSQGQPSASQGQSKGSQASQVEPIKGVRSKLFPWIVWPEE